MVLFRSIGEVVVTISGAIFPFKRPAMRAAALDGAAGIEHHIGLNNPPVLVSCLLSPV